MSAVYWVLITDELVDAGLGWPDGMRLSFPVSVQSDPRHPGAQWYRVEDDRAPEDLDGERVVLTFRLEGRVPVVAGREALP